MDAELLKWRVTVHAEGLLVWLVRVVTIVVAKVVSLCAGRLLVWWEAILVEKMVWSVAILAEELVSACAGRLQV